MDILSLKKCKFSWCISFINTYPIKSHVFVISNVNYSCVTVFCITVSSATTADVNIFGFNLWFGRAVTSWVYSFIIICKVQNAIILILQLKAACSASIFFRNFFQLFRKNQWVKISYKVWAILHVSHFRKAQSKCFLITFFGYEIS